MRRKLIVGNWKMHGSKTVVADLLNGLQTQLPVLKNVDIAVCPPFPYLSWTQQHLPKAIALGAQNVCAEPKGAFTGEVAASMLVDCGCSFAIVGHSERRQLFAESDALVVRKAAELLAHNVTPIVCVGETLEAREANETLAIIGAQLQALLTHVSTTEIVSCVIAYEPIWAIGTGCTASPEQAQEVHAFIRETLAQSLGLSIAQEIKILYGGSVKADNAAALFSQPDIDGGLIGGASLNAEEFAAICRAAE